MAVISSAISLWMAIAESQFAYRTYYKISYREAYVAKIGHDYAVPICLVFAAAGVVVCWLLRGGAWVATAALLIGVGCWVLACLALR